MKAESKNEEQAFELEVLDNPGLTSLYLKCRREYRDIINRAERISRGSAGIPSTGDRMFWGSVLFTRIVVTAKSVNALLPDPAPGSHWDFSAAASIARNLAEACLVFHWLCGENVPEDQREGRFILFHLHDHGSRRRLFPDGPEDPAVYEDLVAQFDKNPYLRTFDEKQRKVALKGEKTPFIQDNVLAEIGEDPDEFRLNYRLFSQHTHTGPISFYRMVDHDRGTGVETRTEKRYLTIVIGASAKLLLRAIISQLAIFPDAETRAPQLTRQQIISNVERAQGRYRGRHKTSTK